MSECRFVAGSLGSGGISEAASMGEQRWRLNVGVRVCAPIPVGARRDRSRACGPDAGRGRDADVPWGEGVE